MSRTTLVLKNIKKDYLTGDSTVHALKGVNMEFGSNEFVSILGHSGCGKTTLLNIIGGLDRYTDGDLVINGISTKDYTDRDWDTYRNHTIGFVFQTYNLIPHQTVLENVELALTLSGVSKTVRKEKAKEALRKVGLGDQINKKPNQLSGGQMQRVAIARALVNNPDIILADEPTGALDSETSVQVLEILKEISATKLVIMVTHNPDLAEKYSTRIIKLADGLIIGDEQKKPYTEEKSALKKEISGKTSMSFRTALQLSFRNLLTKKGRTFLTSFAGSIGIIGIALILALSNGIQSYINRVQEDTLSSYPLQITEQTMDVSGLLESMQGKGESSEHELDAVYSSTLAAQLINSMLSQISVNNLKDFKAFIESEESGMSEYASSFKYSYNIDPNIYTTYKDKETGEEKLLLVNPSDVMEQIYGDMGSTYKDMMSSFNMSLSVWSELIDDDELLNSQYDVIAGRWPTAYNEIVLIVNDKNEISDMVMYALGIKDCSEMSEIMKSAMSGKQLETESVRLTYDEILNMSFKMVYNSDYFVKDRVATIDGEDFQIWKDMSEDEDYIKSLTESDKAVTIKIVGIIRPDENAVATSASGAIGYTSELTKTLIENINQSEIAIQQKANPERNVLTGMEFTTEELTIEDVYAYIATLSEEKQEQYKAFLSQMSESEILSTFKEMMPKSTTYESVCDEIGIIDLESPTAISIYAKTFDDKEHITSIIDSYNAEHENDGNAIKYTDTVALLMSSVSTIIDFVSYALIVFVSISLVVSSIMIGIITYISVLERTKEIGILRAIGASKRDISRVFNAETFVIGLGAGIIGIGGTLLLCIPINLIIGSLSDIWNIAKLPVAGGVILVVISMVLTVVAGLVPSRMASKKDPVEALRSE